MTNMNVLRELQSLAWCKTEWEQPHVKKNAHHLLQQCLELPTPEISDNIEELMEKSDNFPIPFPIDTARVQTLKDKVSIDKLKRNMSSVYPIIHERVMQLIIQFLIYKSEFGSTIEKAFYKDMTIPEFIDRILQKRAITFMGPKDKYKLITGEKDQEGWELVGTSEQKPPLTLDKVLSYDEMKISSMVYVSSFTHFINDGARKNKGVVQDSDIEEEGVIIGLIGPRLKRKFRMEYEDMMVTQEQNCPEKGFGDEVSENLNQSRHEWRRIWSDFYQIPSLTYPQLRASVKIPEKTNEKQKYSDRYLKVSKEGDIFDNEVYHKRLTVSFDCSVMEANDRAMRQGVMAFLNVIGIGLGVWKMSTHQKDVFVLSLLERLRFYLEKDLLHHVANVNLAYINPGRSISALFGKGPEKTILLKSKTHPNGGINVQLENREPSSRLPAEHSNKLLVLTYPWDGNAHPGNEFWIGKLGSSGDPAAACSTQVAELHNAYINTNLQALRTRVVTVQGLVTLRDYAVSCLSKDE